MEWEDFALNAGLFVSLHAFFLTGAALASGAPDGGTAASTAVGRGLGLAAFVALQQARGLPLAAWLGQEAGQSAKQAPVPAVLASPLAPVKHSASVHCVWPQVEPPGGCTLFARSVSYWNTPSM